MPTMRPVRAKANRMRSSPTAPMRALEMLRAAPLSAMIRPNMAPKQMMAVNPPSMSPTPCSSELPISFKGMPKHRAADRAIKMKAAKGGTWPHPIRRISNAMRSTTASTVKTRAAPLKLHPHTHTIHPSEDVVEIGVHAIVDSRLWRGLRCFVEQIVNFEIGRQVPGRVVRTSEIDVGRAPHHIIFNGRMVDGRDRTIRLTLDVFAGVNTIAEPPLGDRQAKLPGIPPLGELAFPVGDAARCDCVGEIDSRALNGNRVGQARVGQETD